MRNFTDYYLKECTGDGRFEAVVISGVGECVCCEYGSDLYVTFVATAWAMDHALANVRIIESQVTGKELHCTAYIVDEDLTDAEAEELMHFSEQHGFHVHFHSAKSQVFHYTLLDKMSEGTLLDSVLQKMSEIKQ